MPLRYWRWRETNQPSYMPVYFKCDLLVEVLHWLPANNPFGNSHPLGTTAFVITTLAIFSFLSVKNDAVLRNGPIARTQLSRQKIILLQQLIPTFSKNGLVDHTRFSWNQITNKRSGVPTKQDSSLCKTPLHHLTPNSFHYPPPTLHQLDHPTIPRYGPGRTPVPSNPGLFHHISHSGPLIGTNHCIYPTNPNKSSQYPTTNPVPCT